MKDEPKDGRKVLNNVPSHSSNIDVNGLPNGSGTVLSPRSRGPLQQRSCLKARAFSVAILKLDDSTG